MDFRKMEHFSSSVILIVAISKAIQLDLVAELDVALGNDSIPSQEEPAVRHWSFQFMPWLSCACSPSFYKKYESVLHDTWLPKKCCICKCWHSQPHGFPQTFLPGYDGCVIVEHFLVSRTSELTLSSDTFLLAGICLAI
ncbi:unnamed protein product [Nyctereutes procyonoides]|uniref:(raccoon dog) hypothetical protein n=1 Tax=Nyctereutes procyonoides TaxID=34880 RepID=A0A811Z348_NYCPR|nr:unnamed protein product [Nyctereutes procyonoides]